MTRDELHKMLADQCRIMGPDRFADTIIHGDMTMGPDLQARLMVVEPARWVDEDGEGWRVMLSDDADDDIHLRQEPSVAFVPDDEDWLTYDVTLFRQVTPEEA